MAHVVGYDIFFALVGTVFWSSVVVSEDAFVERAMWVWALCEHWLAFNDGSGVLRQGVPASRWFEVFLWVANIDVYGSAFRLSRHSVRQK